MGRAYWLKELIRLGISMVPNELSAYRFCSRQGHRLARVPSGFDLTPCLTQGMPGLWIHHPPTCKSRVILYLHGGGYVIGSNRTHLDLACRLARAAEAQVFMLEYRLAPEHPYPAALEDAVLAYQHLLGHGVRPDQVVIAGDSAGGGLTVATLMALRDRKLPLPAAGVCLSPWLDLSCSLSSQSRRQVCDPLLTPSRIRKFADYYAQGEEKSRPGISPFFGDPKGLPPLMLQVGRDEILLEEIEQFAANVRLHGGFVDLDIWHGMFHVWQMTASLLPDGARAITRLGEFIQREVPVYRREAQHLNYPLSRTA